MNELLESVLENNNFLIPYLKQFAKYFNESSKLVEISPLTKKNINYLKELNINIEEYNNQENIDGVLITNNKLYEENIDELFNKIDKILNESGYIFFVIRNKTNILVNLEYHLLNKYNLVEEFISDENWKFLLYQKSTIK